MNFLKKQKSFAQGGINEKLDIEEEYTGDDKKQYKLMKAKLDKLHYNEETKEERIRREINAKEKELEELRKQI